MNDTRRDVPGVVLREPRRRAVDYSRVYGGVVRELNGGLSSENQKRNGQGTMSQFTQPVSLNSDGQPPYIPSGQGTVVRRRREGDRVIDVQRFDSDGLVSRGSTLDCMIDESKIENFKTFLTYVLGSEIRLVMAGYVLNQRPKGKLQYQKLKADIILGRLDKLVDDETARLYIGTHNNKGSITKHMRDTFGPLVAVTPNSSSRSKPFFQLSTNAEKYIIAAQYTYQWLARQDLESMATIFSPKQDQKLPGPVMDVLFLQAVADGCQDSEAIRTYFRSGTTGFQGYDPRLALPDAANLGHSVARRIEKYQTLGYIAYEGERLRLTRKGAKLVQFVQTLYGFFIGDKNAEEIVAKKMQKYSRDCVNPHTVLIPRYFEWNKTADCTFIDSLRVIYAQIPELGEGLNAKEIYERVTSTSNPLTKTKVEEGILLLSMRGYLVSHHIVKEVRHGAGRQNGTLHSLDYCRYTRNPHRQFLP